MATIAPRPRTSPMMATSWASERRLAKRMSPISRARADEVAVAQRLDRGERRRARDGVAAVGTAEAALVDRVHQLGAPGDAGERHAAGQSLGGRDDVGDHALVVDGEPVAGATEAALDLVGDEDDAVGRGPLRQRRQESVGRHDEAALALDRLDEQSGDVLRADLGLDRLDRERGRLGAT